VNSSFFGGFLGVGAVVRGGESEREYWMAFSRKLFVYGEEKP